MASVLSPTAQAIAAHLGGVLHGDGAAPVTGICTLARPRPQSLAFAKTVEKLNGVDPTKDGVVLLAPMAAAGTLSGTYICVDNPRLAFAAAVRHFFAKPASGKIADSARIDPGAMIGRNVTIGEYCVVGAGAAIGDNSELRQHVVIGDRVVIGMNCLVKSHTVIGEEGFGIEKDAEGRNIRVPHLGSVVIGNNVEIGALNIVASGTIDPTVIHDHVKTDDHIHIAHNCHIGENCILTACAEISGSVTLGRNVWLGPNCSIINGISIADDVFVGIGAVVTKNLTEAGVYAGAPARLLPKPPSPK